MFLILCLGHLQRRTSDRPHTSRPRCPDMFFHPMRACIGPLVGTDAFKLETKCVCVCGWVLRVCGPLPLLCLTAYQKTPLASPTLSIKCPHCIYVGPEHAATDIDAHDLTKREDNANGRDLSGIFASMRTSHLEKPSPVIVPH